MVAAYHVNWNGGLSSQLKDEFSLPGSNKIATLSKGMRAKLALIFALSFEPEVLILDEPAGGLDPAARRHIIESILARYQDSGRTIFLSSHLLNEFSGLLDHVAFLSDGGVDLVAPVEQLQREVKRVRLIFEDGIPEKLEVPGAIQTRMNGRDVVGVIDKYAGDNTIKSLENLNASRILIEDMTLEDIFVARVS